MDDWTQGSAEQSITLPLATYLYPLMQSCTLCSPGICKSTSISDAHMLIIGAFSVDRGQHQYPDGSMALQPHTWLKIIVYCVSWHLFIGTSMSFLNNLSYINLCVQAFCSTCTSVSLGQPQPCHCFNTTPFLEHTWPLQTRKPLVAMLCSIIPLSTLLKSWSSPIFGLISFWESNVTKKVIPYDWNLKCLCRS